MRDRDVDISVCKQPVRPTQPGHPSLYLSVSVFVVLQCKLVSGWVLTKPRSTPPYGALWNADRFRRNCSCGASESAFSSRCGLSSVAFVHLPVLLLGLRTHCVRWGPRSNPLQERGNLRVKLLAKNTCNYKLQPNRQPYAATWRIKIFFLFFVCSFFVCDAIEFFDE